MTAGIHATRAQVVAINTQFTYWGYRRADRSERLAVCAELLGLGELSSTSDLTPGQAGQLMRILMQFRASGELPAAAESPTSAGREPAEAHPEAIDATMLAFVLAWYLVIVLPGSRGAAGM